MKTYPFHLAIGICLLLAASAANGQQAPAPLAPDSTISLTGYWPSPVLPGLEPLVIVDGVIVEFPRGRAALNPGSIERIETIPAAEAAGLFGPNARNGLLIITTKSGTPAAPKQERPVR